MSQAVVAPVEEDRPLAIRTGPELARWIATAGIAGLIAGIIVGGIGSRLFMRIAAATASDKAQGAITEAGATVGRITSDGTMFIVVIVGIFAGIIGAVLYAVYRPWLGWAGRFRGVMFGLVLFAVGSAKSDVLNPDNFDFELLQNRAIAVSLIVALFLGFGVVMDSLFNALDRRLPRPGDGHEKTQFAFGVIAALGVAVSTLAIPTFFFSSANCQCSTPILAIAFMVIAAVGTLILWVKLLDDRSDASLSTARLLGYSGLAGTLAFGLWRAGSDAVAILMG